MTDTTTPIPYELHGEHLVLRCFQPTDAAALKEAVDSSIDHLTPWMPWAANEPQSVGEKVDLLRGFRGRFDLGQDFAYGMFDLEQSRVLGGCGLHKRSNAGTLEIGYWVRAGATGRGIATTAASMLAKAAFLAFDVIRLDILVDPANAASVSIPRKLGFTEDGLRRRALPGFGPHTGTHRDVLSFSMLPGEFERSPARDVELRALDAVGQAVPLG